MRPALGAGVADDGERRRVGPQPRIFGEAIAGEIETRRNGFEHERTNSLSHGVLAFRRQLGQARRDLTNVESNRLAI